MTTNLSESYNAVIKGARSLPISALVRKLFYNCVGYFQQRQKEASSAIRNGIVFTDIASKTIEKWRLRATRNKVKTFSRPLGIYEVETRIYTTEYGKKGGHKHTVEIFNKKCTCKKWETFKIPCSHAFVCMQHLRIHPSRLIESWCFNENQILIYQKSFRPIGDRNTWMQEDDLHISFQRVMKQELVVDHRQEGFIMRWI